MKMLLLGLALGSMLWLTPPLQPAGAVPSEVAPEVAPATVTGVVEDVNREDLTVTILTDSGRLLSFSAAGNDVINDLHAGDRVQIQIVMEDEDAAEAPDLLAPRESRKSEI